MSLTVTVSGSFRPGMNMGGSVWLYLMWAQALRAVGCRVIWLEIDTGHNPDAIAFYDAVAAGLAEYGLDAEIAICPRNDEPLRFSPRPGWLSLAEAGAASDLFLNIAYVEPTHIVGAFARSAFVDSDPGLFQKWLSKGEMTLPAHHRYFTTGEGVAAGTALVPNCGIDWQFTPTPIHLPAWPVAASSPPGLYTTVSNWWGRHEWIEHDGVYQCNNKREAFLEYLDLPKRTHVPLELALTLTDHPADVAETANLKRHGWRVRPLPGEVWTPETFRRYVQSSRGEFSCAKPFYVRLDPGVILDRTLYYLASGKPAVVQWTGPSSHLPDAEGLFRFRDMDEVVRSLQAVEADYDRHSRLARALVEEHFEGVMVVTKLLERVL
jgi:hypothetical protein